MYTPMQTPKHSPRSSQDRSWSPFQDISSHSKVDALSDAEIEEFFKDIDADGDGNVTFAELEAKLAEVHKELAPNPDAHDLHHPERRFIGKRQSQYIHDPEKALTPERDPEQDGLHAFLKALLPATKSSISREDFIAQVKTWNVPSQKQTSTEDEDGVDNAYAHRMTWYRKIRAYWSVQGPKIAFITFVFCLTLAFFLWQGLYYYFDPAARAALGWGVVMAKFCAGALYPLLFFMLLSMSRWFATFMRRFYWISRFANWDRSQSFHMQMAIIVVGFSTLHAIGHLTGSFVSGSRPENQHAVDELFGAGTPTMKYTSFLRIVAGWSGLTSLGLLYTILLLSLPQVRKWSYELFQLGHLLMFPFFGLMCAHGAQKLLQYPMLGFWICFPVTLIIIERGLRIIRGFIRLPARIEILDKETVNLTVKHPKGKNWRYSPGQYVFLQVPKLSLFQWHPFTVSVCIGDELQLHIKTDGNWTGQLRSLATASQSRQTDIFVGLDGPFGAPAQRFYDFDRSLIIGSGVGITPFSAIIADLELHLGQWSDPWANASRNPSRVGSRVALSRASSSTNTAVNSPAMSRDNSRAGSFATMSPPGHRLLRSSTFRMHTMADDVTPSRRRVDFHWMVRERNSLLWFSALLNRVHDLASDLPRDKLELNIVTHITAKRKNISTHVFRYLLDAYRTSSAPVSALTGLKARSNFGRPDLEAILTDFYKNEVARMRLEGTWGSGAKVGVFFCGAPAIGRMLADACEELTTRGRADGSKVRFVFMMEVFG